jgi:hypothetical protein
VDEASLKQNQIQFLRSFMQKSNEEELFLDEKAEKVMRIL